jgi:hypothetical protein
MKTSALKMVRNARPPQTSPDQSDRSEQSRPVGPGKPVSGPVETGFKPANDPFLGLVSGAAPDPTTEIPPEQEPVFPVETETGEEGERLFKRLNLETASRDTGNRYLELATRDGVPVATASNMSEEDFIEFWAIDVWDALSAICMLFRFNISEIETAQEDEEQARKGAKMLYRMALRKPKMFGWMISENTIEGADWMTCISFFGAKAAAIFFAVKARFMEKKRKAKEKAEKEDTQTPFLPNKDRSGPVRAGGKADA